MTREDCIKALRGFAQTASYAAVICRGGDEAARNNAALALEQMTVELVRLSNVCLAEPKPH